MKSRSLLKSIPQDACKIIAEEQTVRTTVPLTLEEILKVGDEANDTKDASNRSEQDNGANDENNRGDERQMMPVTMQKRTPVTRVTSAIKHRCL